jgi:hypothetical protein
LTIDKLIVWYLEFARVHYRKESTARQSAKWCIRQVIQRE